MWSERVEPSSGAGYLGPESKIAGTTPVIPAQSGIQTTPVIPALSGIQTTPVIPAQSGIQTTPVIPAQSGIHTTPVIPAQAGILQPTPLSPIPYQTRQLRRTNVTPYSDTGQPLWHADQTRHAGSRNATTRHSDTQAEIPATTPVTPSPIPYRHPSPPRRPFTVGAALVNADQTRHAGSRNAPARHSDTQAGIQQPHPSLRVPSPIKTPVPHADPSP